MSFPEDARQIDSPAELTQILDEIAAAVRGGRLKQLSAPADKPFASRESIAAIAGQPTFPDIIEMYFLDVMSGQEYRLNVETYHGQGGMWEPYRR